MASCLPRLLSCGPRPQAGGARSSDPPGSVTHTMFKAPPCIGSSLTTVLFPASANLTSVCLVERKRHAHKCNNIWFKAKKGEEMGVVLRMKSAS